MLPATRPQTTRQAELPKRESLPVRLSGGRQGPGRRADVWRHGSRMLRGGCGRQLGTSQHVIEPTRSYGVLSGNKERGRQQLRMRRERGRLKPSPRAATCMPWSGKRSSCQRRLVRSDAGGQRQRQRCSKKQRGRLHSGSA